MALGHVARAKALIPRSDPGRAAALELLAESVVARYS
jgi:hypothetical protein